VKERYSPWQSDCASTKDIPRQLNPPNSLAASGGSGENIQQVLGKSAADIPNTAKLGRNAVPAFRKCTSLRGPFLPFCDAPFPRREQPSL
jgi:hypothetical protein